jgi:hypothetical protein
MSYNARHPLDLREFVVRDEEGLTKWDVLHTEAKCNLESGAFDTVL